MDLQTIAALVAGALVTLLILWLIYRWRAGRAARKGRRGEKLVADELARLKRSENILLNDLLIPVGGDKTSQIDHVLISTRGIFVIETKSLAGRITGSEFGQYWTQHLSSQSRSIYNPLLQNRTHVKVIRRLLPELPDSLFTSVVVFTEAWRLDIKADDVVISRSWLPDKRIRRTFIPTERSRKRWWRPGREIHLEERQIVTPLDGLCEEIKRRRRVIERDDLADLARRIRAVNEDDRASRKEHTRYARQTSANISREIRQGVCPRCGSPLVDRRTFIGCSNYPACRFTCPIDRLHS